MSSLPHLAKAARSEWFSDSGATPRSTLTGTGNGHTLKDSFRGGGVLERWLRAQSSEHWLLVQKMWVWFLAPIMAGHNLLPTPSVLSTHSGPPVPPSGERAVTQSAQVRKTLQGNSLVGYQGCSWQTAGLRVPVCFSPCGAAGGMLVWGLGWDYTKSLK